MLDIRDVAGLVKFPIPPNARAKAAGEGLG